MKKALLAILTAALLPTTSFAACYGSGTYQTCTDNSGNNYNVQRYGNTTYIQGSNPSTGSTWNQTSTRMGNTTIHNGTAANGNTWSGTSTNIGNTTIHQGIDSQGNSYNRHCNQLGCN